MKTQPNFRFLSFFIILLGLAIAWSCQKEDPTPPASSEKTISALSFDGVVQGASVDIQGTNITVTVPYGTDITALAPTIMLPKGATISPASGVKQDFTKPVIYTVTAEDGSKQTFTVTVSQGVAPKSTAKEIKSFVFKSFTPAIVATIDSAAKTITTTLPVTADLTRLSPEITLSAKATVSPASGATQDFTQPVTYTVTAEDGSTKVFVVSVKKEVEVAVDPNDLPDFNGCEIQKLSELYSNGLVFFEENFYQNKRLIQINSGILSNGKLTSLTSRREYVYESPNVIKCYGTDSNAQKYLEYEIVSENDLIKSITWNDDNRTVQNFFYENFLVRKIETNEKGVSAYTTTYEYDNNNNIARINSHRINNTDNRTHTFGYDSNKNSQKGNFLRYLNSIKFSEDAYNKREPFFLHQNKNNVTSINSIEGSISISRNMIYTYVYNNEGYPISAESSQLFHGQNVNDAVIRNYEFQYYNCQ